ncbi:MAG: hypothetical protein M3460_11210 [Actinomycetota bacterium]|nr:hypothetical protein [Actinomycetota bacterium]
MTTGEGPVPYGEHLFLTVAEARWAVFFDAKGDPWHYDPRAEWGLGNEQHYRPQFSLPRLSAYLEVQRPDDHRTRHVLHHYDPEIEEHHVYLAVGDLPDEQQLATTGWWDSERDQGVMMLTPSFEWEKWFPPDRPRVLQALEAAKTKEFGPAVPLERQPEEEVSEIPEREREQRPD